MSTNAPSNHGEAAVVELLVAVVEEGLLVLVGDDLEGVEAEVAADHVLLDAGDVRGAELALVPQRSDRLGLDERDDEEERRPEERVHVLDLLEVKDGAVHLLLVEAPQAVDWDGRGGSVLVL